MSSAAATALRGTSTTTGALHLMQLPPFPLPPAPALRTATATDGGRPKLVPILGFAVVKIGSAAKERCGEAPHRRATRGGALRALQGTTRCAEEGSQKSAASGGAPRTTTKRGAAWRSVARSGSVARSRGTLQSSVQTRAPRALRREAQHGRGWAPHEKARGPPEAPR
jgi:hypothetical protein